jgi:hypothetical protein
MHERNVIPGRDSSDDFRTEGCCTPTSVVAVAKGKERLMI